MAPEQLQKQEITTAVDVYALGMVMYEMVTGTRPFGKGSSLSSLIRRLREPPPSPRTHVPDMDPLWEAVILRCLERDPADRFASAADVARALGGKDVAPGKRATRVRRRRWAGAVFLALALVASVIAYRVHRIRPLQPAGSARRSVAVPGFRNVSEKQETSRVSTALAEMLATELAGGGRLRTIPGESVARMKAELALMDNDSLAADTLARIRRDLGTDSSSSARIPIWARSPVEASGWT